MRFLVFNAGALCACAWMFANMAESFPLGDSDLNLPGGNISTFQASARKQSPVGIEEKKLLMRGVLAAFYSAEVLVGALVLCIMAINGACCLCPRKDRRRLVALLEAQRRRGAGQSASKSLVPLGFSIISLGMVAAESSGEKKKEGGSSLDEEAKKAVLASMYAGFWSFKIILGCIIVCILGIQGACCLCPRSEQARLLALKEKLKKIEMEKEEAAKVAAAKSS
jgi:hypothetical protein